MRLPPPRAKTPIKTFLKSPARRNPSLGPLSSPVRGSIEPRDSATASVRRRLEFSSADLDANVLESSTANGSPQRRGNSNSISSAANITNGRRLAPGIHLQSENINEDNTQEDILSDEDDTAIETNHDSFQMIDAGEDNDSERLEEEPEARPEQKKKPKSQEKPQTLPSKRGRGRGKAGEPNVVAEAPTESLRRSTGTGRSNPKLGRRTEEDIDERPAKRTRRSLAGSDAISEPVPKAKGRPRKTAATNEPEPKAATKKPKLAPIAEAESPEAQRGPPMPKLNRGLLIIRRETPMDGSGFKQTRSGRNSIKPLAYWKNERAEYSEDEIEDGQRKFITSRIKGVVRIDEVEEKRKKKSYYRPSKGKKRAAAVESDDEAELWETSPGQVHGPIRTWDPQDPTGVYAAEVEDEIAISSAAINTREVPGATFKFAKTLTLPFLGSGMVDLPAGAEKKTKNARRMHMVFFVFYGKVEVTVNETTFIIGKGGMWQVPRGIFSFSFCERKLTRDLGNTYSISNDYDRPARIFFTQGCEPVQQVEDEGREESQSESKSHLKYES